MWKIDFEVKKVLNCLIKKESAFRRCKQKRGLDSSARSGWIEKDWYKDKNWRNQ